MIKTYKIFVWNVLVGIDQLCSVIYFGADPDETISSITAKRQHKPFYYRLGQLLEYIDPGHLSKFIEHDEGDYSVFSKKHNED